MLYLGADLRTWLGVLHKTRFAVTPKKIPAAIIATAAAAANSILGSLQSWRYASSLEKVDPQAPLFILGHWRTGTTLLHEFLSLDQQFGFPNNYACFAPHHFLLTEEYLARGFNILAPMRRPMDSMVLSWERPQEDEFGLLGLGARSPYWSFVFPESIAFAETMSSQWSIAENAAWKSAFLQFAKCLTLKLERRLLMKSPAHMFRVELLCELFPDAQFVHLVRRPYETIASTLNMHRRLREYGSMQGNFPQQTVEAVTDEFVAFHSQACGVSQRLGKNLHQLRYEDFVRNPTAELHALYAALNLGFEDIALSHWHTYWERASKHRPAVYPLSQSESEYISERCESVFKRYNYDVSFEAQISKMQ